MGWDEHHPVIGAVLKMIDGQIEIYWNSTFIQISVHMFNVRILVLCFVLILPLCQL